MWNKHGKVDKGHLYSRPLRFLAATFVLLRFFYSFFAMIIFLFDFAPVKIRVLRGNTFFLDVFFEILDSELTWQYLTVGFHLNRRPGLVSLWTRRHLRFLVKDGDTHTFPSFIEKSNDHSLLKCQSLNYNVVGRVLLHLPFFVSWLLPDVSIELYDDHRTARVLDPLR